jgi:hypothetical protein
MKRFAAKGLRSNAQIMSTSVSLLTNRLSLYPKTPQWRITVDEERRFSCSYDALMRCYAQTIYSL